MSFRKRVARAQVVLIAGAIFGLSACVNLPSALERELTCPPPGAPDNFASAAACATANQH